MEAVAVSGGFLQQLGIDQHFQRIGNTLIRLAEQRGGRGQANRRAGPQTQQPEGVRGIYPVSRGTARQAGEADLEARPHGQVTGLEPVQPAAFVG